MAKNGRLRFLEPQFQLINKPRAVFRALAVDLPLQLGDPQLLMGDQRLVIRRLGCGDRQLRGDGVHCRHRGVLFRNDDILARLSQSFLLAGDQQRRFQRANIIRKGLKIGVHGQD